MTLRIVQYVVLGWLALAIVPFPAVAYVSNDRWVATATDGSLGVTADPPTPGAPATVTWSLVPDGALVPGNESGTTLPSNLIGFLDANFGAGPGGADYTARPWFPIFEGAFARLTSLSGLTFVYEPHDDGARLSRNDARGVLGVRGDIRLSGKGYAAGSNTLASNYYPDYGDMLINTNQVAYFTNSANNFRRLRNTLTHELMHGVGVSHVRSSTSTFLIEPTLSSSIDGPQLDDLLAIQRLYGDVHEKNGGNDAPELATPLPAVGAGVTRILGGAGNGVLIAPDETDFLSIDDDSDFDFFSFSVDETLNVTLELAPRGAVYSVGPEGEEQSSLNSAALSDLALSLFASDGVTLLTAVDSGELGGGESILRQLDAGTYFPRVTGAQDDIQLYQLSVAAAAAVPRNLAWTGAYDSVWTPDGAANFHNGVNEDVFRSLDNVTFENLVAAQPIEIQGEVSAGEISVHVMQDVAFWGEGRLAAGSLTVAGGGVVTLANSDNSYAGPTTILGGTLRITGDANAMVSPISIADGGVLVMDAAAAAEMASAFTVWPGGVLEIGGPETSGDVFPDAPTALVNNGLIRVFDAELLTNISGAGELALAGETAELRGNADFSGNIVVGPGAAASVIDSTGLGDSGGATAIHPGGRVVIDADVALNESFDFSDLGEIGVPAGMVQIEAGRSVELHGGMSIRSAAKLALAAEARAVLDGSLAAVDGPATLVVDVGDGAEASLAGAIELQQGTLAKTGPGLVRLRNGAELDASVVVEQGAVAISGDHEFAQAFHVHSGAELQIASEARFAPAASLAGDGTVVGDLEFPGTISPGAGPGVLVFEGDLSLTDAAVVSLELAATTLGAGYDQIRASGGIELSGRLTVSLLAGFNPLPGETFSLLTALTIGDTFDSAALPVLGGGLQWSLQYLADEVRLAVVDGASSMSADFNGDGHVDADDLLVWQTGFGTEPPAANASGDADGDSLVDGADFLLWQRQYSDRPVPPGVAVPELSSGLLAVMAATLLFGRKRGASAR